MIMPIIGTERIPLRYSHKEEKKKLFLPHSLATIWRDICVHIQPIIVPNGVGLQKAADFRMVVPGTVVVVIRFRIKPSGGEVIWVVHIADAIRLAENVVGIGFHHLIIHI